LAGLDGFVVGLSERRQRFLKDALSGNLSGGSLYSLGFGTLLGELIEA